MATNISNETGLSTQGWKENERKVATTRAPVVEWHMTPNNDQDRLEFWYSTDNGASWQERTSKRITDIELNRGADMEICTRPDGTEAIIIVYVDRPGATRKIRFAFGLLNANRTNWSWIVDHKAVSVDEGADGAISNPSVITAPLGNIWHNHVFWSKRTNSGTKTSLYWQRVDIEGTRHRRAGNEIRIHRRSSTTHTRPSCDVRHLGDDYLLYAQDPTIYIAWFSGDGNDPPNNPLPRMYMRRIEYSGSSWAPSEGEKIVYMEDTANSSRMGGVFTGKAWVSAAPPFREPDRIIMHIMTPENSERKESVYVPDLGLGNIQSIALGYDASNGDVFVFAAGDTNNRPNYIVFDWDTQTWSAWTEINTEQLLQSTLSCSRGSKGKKIALSYARENPSSPGNKQIRFEWIPVNLPTAQATWDTEVTISGANDINATNRLKWFHNDPDNDPQASYQLRKSTDNGATWLYYTGSVFVATPTTSVNSSTEETTLATSWALDGDIVLFQVATSDQVGVGYGPWSDTMAHLGSVRVDPTLDSPTQSEVVTGPSIDVAWTVAEQSMFKIDWLTGDGLTLIGTSGWVAESATRNYEIPYEFENNSSYDIQIQTANQEGLRSVIDKHDITTSFLAPPVPTFAEIVVPRMRVDVDITNPAPGGGEAATVHNDVFRIFTDDNSEKKIAETVPPDAVVADWAVPHNREVTYRVVAYAATGTFTSS
ncbi:hypothetical protein [Neptunomonas sp.]|uniref:hypothetical protein n=1 Tax=Neptunomonas sp. TaxID=1971898 RepID=UPI003561530F